jgi:acyl-CoA synthetase (AMP-forming)/AMP-acid ligase II
MSEPTLHSFLERVGASPRGLRFIDQLENDIFYSYEDIFRRAARTAGGLTRLGVRRGDRVAIILPTSIYFFDAFYGATLAGAVPVPLYPPVRLGRLDEYHIRTAGMLRACGVRLLLTDKRIGRLLGRTIQQASPELGAVAVNEIPDGTGRRAVSSPDDLALIQFSSGTQQSPKPVGLTHRQIVANVEAIRSAILAVHPEDAGLTHVGASWLPLYHDMGLVGSVLTALIHPSDLVLMPPELFVSRPSIWLRMISKFSATVTVAPNFAYSLCADRIEDEELAGVDLSSLRVALNGAEPVTPSALVRFVERFRAFGLREEALTPVYGLAEATLAVTFSDLLKPFNCVSFDRDRLVEDKGAEPAANGFKLVGVGKALPVYSIRIVDDDASRLPNGRIGRVLVHGPSIMEGYYGRSGPTSGVMDGKWLDTGDTGFIHEGELFLYGRRKDLIILRGRNYAPVDIEQSLEGIKGLRRGCWAAVGVVPESGEGEELFVFVERDRQGDPDQDRELARAVSGRVTESMGLLPEKVLVLEPGTLPRTSSGKIRRQETRRRYQNGTLNPPGPVNVFVMAGEVIRSKLASLRR